MILLTTEVIIEIHSKLISQTGGIDGIRDINLLESEVFSSSYSFMEQDFYPTIEEKAARLMFSITNNHAFLDGNKRIGVLMMLLTLSLNNVKIQYLQEELVLLGLPVADGTIKYDDILKWILSYKK